MRGFGLLAPADVVGRRKAFQRRRKRRRRGVDGKMRPVDAAKLLGARMHMHQRLPRRRNVEHGVALRRQLAEAAADQHDQIGRFGARHQFRDWGRCRVRRRSRDAAGRTDACGGRWSPPAARTVRRNFAANSAPPPTTGCRRPAPAGARLPRISRSSCVDLRRAGRGLDRLERRRVDRDDSLGQHVFRQRDDHRARPYRWLRCRKRARPVPECARDRRSRSPIWRSIRTPRGSRAPGRPRARACRARPGRRTGSSASNPGARRAEPAAALVAPGPRVTKQMPGRPVALPTASAIIAAPPSWRQTVTAIGRS